MGVLAGLQPLDPETPPPSQVLPHTTTPSFVARKSPPAPPIHNLPEAPVRCQHEVCYPTHVPSSKHTYPAASTRIQQHPSGTPTTPPGCLMFRRLFPVHFETSPCGAPAHTMSTSCVLESEPWRPPQRANGASGVHPRRSTPMSVRSTPMLSGCLPLFTATTAPGGSGGVLPYCIEQ